MLPDQGLELTDDLVAGTQLDPGGHRVLDQSQPDLLQPGAVRRCPVSGIDEHVASEQRQTLARIRQRTCRIARDAGLGGQGGERHRAGGIDGFRFDGQGVAVLVTDDKVLVAQRPAELGDLRLQGVATGRLDHRSSISPSVRTGEPAARASRANSSDVLPAGRSSRTPSRRTSTVPRTDTVSTVRE